MGIPAAKIETILPTFIPTISMDWAAAAAALGFG
jgi:hypothetical protein